MAILVRAAEPGDFVPITSLLQELGRPVVLGTPNEAGAREVFDAWLADPNRFAFVAEEGGEIVGFVDVVLQPWLNFLEPEAHVPDLIVTERARSRGAGAALLAAAEALGRERGAFALSLDSANWRTRAHAFYRREGMEDTARHFVKALGDRAWPPAPPGDADRPTP
ncbi:MAG TPA: GNAT family N-acetyltransferase [Actinomycetota bacterium]|nr:GNAT family N-acetyltransferase [Actinomycetota bacterium]